jgi:asparagine synthase (glutamine-hydrolysing)
MSMAHSIEGRYPFLDHNVIQLFSEMPDDLKLNIMDEKYILKETFKDILPSEIITRNKQPYRAPEAICFFNSQMEKKYFNKETINKHNYFNWEYVDKLRKKMRGKINNISFNDNFIYTNILATTIFQENIKTNFKCEINYPLQKEIREIEL